MVLSAGASPSARTPAPSTTTWAARSAPTTCWCATISWTARSCPPSPRCWMGLLEAAVDRALDRLREAGAPTLDRQAALQKEHEAAQQRIERLVDALADGAAPAEDIKRRL